MTEDVDAPADCAISSNEWDQIVTDSWAAYENLLTALQNSIHYETSADTIEIALEALFKIGEVWTVHSRFQLSNRLPFSKQSEIDLIATLMSLASYSSPAEDLFIQLQQAFLETTQRSKSNALPFG